MEAVLAGSDGKGSVGNTECVFAGQTMTGGFNGVSPSGYDEIILGNNSVSCLGADGEGSASVEGQIGFGKDDGVQIVFVDGDVRSAIGQGVFRSVSQGEVDMIGLQCVDGRGVCAGNIHPVEHQLYLGGVRRINLNLPVIQCS